MPASEHLRNICAKLSNLKGPPSHRTFPLYAPCFFSARTMSRAMVVQTQSSYKYTRTMYSNINVVLG